jgi:hypothetical protein
MTRYRLLDDVDWTALHGKTIRLEVSEGYLIATPLTKGGRLVILAKAITPRPAKTALSALEHVMTHE